MTAQTIAALDQIAWAPSPSPAVVEEGNPSCQELVLHAAGDLEVGLWQVTPGRFRSKKVGIGETMTFLAGAGTLHHDAGGVSVIAPGVVVHLEPGWSGVWDVTETVTKSYTIFPA